ncbi:MAG: hypothetical protein ACJZ4Z_03960 [Candidatus Thalassarchaeaceae archaeon]
MIFDLLPSFPPETLKDWTFIVLLISLVIRIFLVLRPIKEISKFFDGQTVTGLKLIRELEIKGINQFVITEISLALLPALLGIPVMYYFGVDDVLVSQMDSIILTFFIIGMLTWLYIDYKNSDNTNKKLIHAINELDAMAESLSSLKKLTGLDKLNLLVQARKGLIKIKNLSVSKLPKNVQKAGSTSSDFLSSLISPATTFLGNLGGAIVDTVSEKITEVATFGLSELDEFLEDEFKNYTKRTHIQIIATLMRTLAPSVFVTLLAIFHLNYY